MNTRRTLRRGTAAVDGAPRLWRALGWTGNPYRVAAPHEMAALVRAARVRLDRPSGARDRGRGIVTEIEPAAVARGDHGGVVQILGGGGHGKTSLLEAVQVLRADAVRMVRVPYEGPWRVVAPDGDGALLVDEAQRLGRRTLRGLVSWQQGAGPGAGRLLVLAAHRDLRVAAGVGCVSLSIEPPDAAWLVARHRERIVGFAGGDPCRAPLTEGAAEWLLGFCRGNLRGVAAVLYECFQARGGTPTSDATRLDRPTVEAFARRTPGIEVGEDPRRCGREPVVARLVRRLRGP